VYDLQRVVYALVYVLIREQQDRGTYLLKLRVGKLSDSALGRIPVFNYQRSRALLCSLV
jgi:hypothetical protein